MDIDDCWGEGGEVEKGFGECDVLSFGGALLPMLDSPGRRILRGCLQSGFMAECPSVKALAENIASAKLLEPPADDVLGSMVPGKATNLACFLLWSCISSSVISGRSGTTMHSGQVHCRLAYRARWLMFD